VNKDVCATVQTARGEGLEVYDVIEEGPEQRDET